MEHTLDRYSALALEKKRIEAEMDELKPMIVKFIEEKGEKTLKLPVGTFSLRTMKTWTYSEKVTAAADEVKQLKKLEEEDGTATAVESSTLQFKGIE